MSELDQESFKRGLAVGLMAGAVIARRERDPAVAYRKIKAEADKLNVFGVSPAGPVEGAAEYDSWLPTPGEIEYASWFANPEPTPSR